MSFSFQALLECLPLLLRGAVLTITISLASFAFALFGGLVLWYAISSGPKVVRLVSTWIADFIRSTPLLVQVFVVYFVGPTYGLTLDPVWAGIITFGVHYSCYMAEVYRACYLAVPAGQWDAAKSMALSRASGFSLVILPQMIPTFIPLAGGYLIYMFKDTPILAAVTVREMMYAAQKFGSDNFTYLEPLTLAGILFLLMSVATALILRFLEGRFSRWITAK
jgi:polar amino acid transport system permease protein